MEGGGLRDFFELSGFVFLQAAPRVRIEAIRVEDVAGRGFQG